MGNFSDEPVEVRLEIERDGAPVDVLPLQLPADGLVREVLAKASAEGGRFTARLDRPDSLAADDTAVAILPARDPLPVTLVTKGQRFADLYVEKVLEANPLVRQPLAVVADPQRGSSTAGVAVYHQMVPAKLPPGPVLVIDPLAGCDLWDVGGVIDRPVVTRVERESPGSLPSKPWSVEPPSSIAGSWKPRR